MTVLTERSRTRRPARDQPSGGRPATRRFTPRAILLNVVLLLGLAGGISMGAMVVRW